jgi:hypothetical protein
MHLISYNPFNDTNQHELALAHGWLCAGWAAHHIASTNSVKSPVAYRAVLQSLVDKMWALVEAPLHTQGLVVPHSELQEAEECFLKVLLRGPRAPGSQADSDHYRGEELRQVVERKFHRGEVGEAA